VKFHIHPPFNANDLYDERTRTMTAADSIRHAGDAYHTRLAHSEAGRGDDEKRLAQEGFQSKLARDAAGMQPDTREYYKMGEMIGGRYEVSAIHHGGMGVVYGCFDHQTKLPRALKTIRTRHAHDKQMLSLFESEATVWISLEKHPYIVRAYLVEIFDNLPYVIAEYVSGPEGMGEDLRGWLGHPRLTLPVAVAMSLQIAQGMQHAVRKVPNLVHRDLKPGNILVNGDGKAMVTDFGLVNAAQSGAGTPAYMSPEQWLAEALDPRSDIYSYGCILFEMFTAHRLFPALTERDWESAHLESTPATLTSLVPELPNEIDRFVRCCLEKNPGARPQSWDEVVTFFAEWYHRLTGKAVVFDFSSLALNAIEWLTAGYSLVVLNRLDGALQAFDRAIEIDQSFLHAWFYKGVVLSALKRYDEAILAYDRALVIDPNSGDVFMNKGNALRDLKRYEEAIQAYDGALAIAPNSSDVLIQKGNILYELNRYEEAIQAYDGALVIDQNNVKALYHKANALHKLNRHDEAIKTYDKALAIDPTFFFAPYIKSLILRDLERYEEANLACDQVIAINPKHVDVLLNKGNMLYKLNRFEDAIQAYDKVLAIDPKNAIALKNKSISLRDLNRDALKIFHHTSAFKTMPRPSALKTVHRPWYSWVRFWDK